MKRSPLTSTGWKMREPFPGLEAGCERVPLGLFEGDPRQVARALLGKTLITLDGDMTTGGKIVETEAYLGRDDPGSHASTRGITRRNATMYGPPACAYVYFVYGMHHMLNFVCLPEGQAGAVLIRAIEPTLGLEVMSERRGVSSVRDLTCGPGRLAKALGIGMTDNGSRLDGDRFALFEGAAADLDISVSGRIGLSAGHELQLRYYLTGNSFVSFRNWRNTQSVLPNEEQEPV